jgi:hypothetical protein
MAVESAKLDDFAVQFETMIGKFGFAEAEMARVFVEDLLSFQQPDVNRVEIAVMQVPELDTGKISEINDN